MPDQTPWLTAAPLVTPRLHLEPLRVAHAREAAPVFNDVRLHTWIGGEPRSFEQLEAQYRRQSAGQSADGTQGWLNWLLRRASDGQLVGTVQATLSRPADERVDGRSPTDRRLVEAALAWVVGVDHQGNGYAREGALAMAHWLRAHEVDRLTAYIHPGNDASVAVARTLGLAPTDIVLDGEVRWSDSGPIRTGTGTR
ncbi:GNAT family N-acetyltransferase [Micromonospora sonneratiae]|uniref:GNAT family N-acetyltransferase n=1 Tax=Micromonospora sonneratiae TaxID=1184706 RepID=A0ABW3YR65_9ACTN